MARIWSRCSVGRCLRAGPRLATHPRQRLSAPEGRKPDAACRSCRPTRPCTSPDRTHGPPLAFGSCSSPAPDLGPADGRLAGRERSARQERRAHPVRREPARGNPATPADEADVRLIAPSINDVRLASDLTDYTRRRSRPASSCKITDRDNTPHPGGPGAATVQDLTHSFPIPAPRPPTPRSARLRRSTPPSEALVPGAVKERRRSIWELGRRSRVLRRRRRPVHDAGDLRPVARMAPRLRCRS